MFRKIYLLVTLSFIFITVLSASSIRTINNGEFSDPAVWENSVLPDLSVDSILIYHQITADIEIHLTGISYLHIFPCARLCCNLDFYLDSPTAAVLNEGLVQAETIYIKGEWLNQGDFKCRHFIMGGQGHLVNSVGGTISKNPNYTNTCNLSYAAGFNTISSVNIVSNEVSLIIKLLDCAGIIDFGDGTGFAELTSPVNHTYANSGTYTIKIISYCACNDTAMQEREIFVASVCSIVNSVRIYPNPSFGQFGIELNRCSPGSYLLPVFNSTGQLITNINIIANSGIYDYDFTNLAPGVYFLRMPAETGIKTQRIVIVGD